MKAYSRPGSRRDLRFLAGGAERLRHEQVADRIGIGGGAAQADHVPPWDQRRLRHREQQRARQRRAARVQPQRAVRLLDLGVRAHPGGLTAAAGELPLAADPVAARHRPGARGVRLKHRTRLLGSA